MSGEPERKHLADLHEEAARLGVPDYRKLRKDELVRKLAEARDGGAQGDGAERKGRRRGRRRGAGASEQGREPRQRGREPRRDREPKGDREPQEDDAPTRPVSGVLEIMPQRYGFIRLEGVEPQKDDVYVSASQIRRCELKPGDAIEGPARDARRGERHPALVRVERVNGAAAEGAVERPEFDALTPVPASRPLAVAGLSGDRAEGLAGFSFGHRVLVIGEPQAGGAELLREIATGAPEGVQTTVLLVDVRPEEVTEWRRSEPDAEVIALTADRRPSEQARIARLALARAKRQVEAGADVLLLIDSLSRLGLAYRDPVEVKTVFAAGRELEEEGAGSLTIVGTVLVGTGAATDEQVHDSVVTTENLQVRL
jgi:transcription termination factor Rho